MKKIEVNDDLCIGCGSCEAIAPEYFEIKDDGKSHVKSQYNEEDKDKIQEAVDGCPVGAIKISEAGEKKKK